MPRTDYDSPWKEALDLYFQAFLAFFFPAIHRDIDWARGIESLDKELQQIAPKAVRGRLYVDKLVKVWRTNGQEAWVLIHVEVQTRRDVTFTWRLFVYNNRIFDRYNHKVVSNRRGTCRLLPHRSESESRKACFRPLRLLWTPSLAMPVLF
jgi:hypothetical protein